MDLKDLYKGVGVNSKAVLAAENNVQELFYTGKKNTHMYWDELEIRLTNAFLIVNRESVRQVHTDESKLRLLNN